MTDTIQDLKSERDRLQDRVDHYEREAQDRYDERQRARQQRKRDMAESLLHASDWPEAFRNGLCRFRREADGERADNEKWKDQPDYEPQDYFIKTTAEIEQSEAIYNEIMVGVEREIVKMREAALLRVADEIEKRLGENLVCQAIREGNPEWLTNW